MTRLLSLIAVLFLIIGCSSQDVLVDPIAVTIESKNKARNFTDVPVSVHLKNVSNDDVDLSLYLANFALFAEKQYFRCAGSLRDLIDRSRLRQEGIRQESLPDSLGPGESYRFTYITSFKNPGTWNYQVLFIHEGIDKLGHDNYAYTQLEKDHPRMKSNKVKVQVFGANEPMHD